MPRWARAGVAYDAVADGWARRQKASLGPPSLSLSLSSLLSQCGGRSGQVSRSIALSRLARSPAVSFPDTIFCQSDLKKVSTLSLMSLTFQIDHASPRQQSKNLWFSVLRFSPLSDFPPSNCSPLGQREEGAPACRVRVIISNMTSQSVETNPSLARSKSGRFVRSFVRLQFANKSPSSSLSLLVLLPDSGERERGSAGHGRAVGLINCESFPRTRIKLEREREEAVAAGERVTWDGNVGYFGTC